MIGRSYHSSLKSIRECYTDDQLDAAACAVDMENRQNHTNRPITLIQENPHYIGKDEIDYYIRINRI